MRDEMKEKRALWLINNPHIRSHEVAILMENGYEVFTPKILRFSCGADNASVTWEYDKTLSLSEEELALLNSTDFYGEISPEVREVINKRFNIAFLQYYPEQLKMLVSSFSGGIVLRASGRTDSFTYTEQITDDLGYGFHMRIKKIIDRFWFTEMYPGLAKREGDYLRRTAKCLPVCFDTPAYRENDHGGEILVHFPGINMSTERHEKYRSLRDEIKKIPYSVVGIQPVAVPNDKHVSGTDGLERCGSACCWFEPVQGSYELPYAALEAMTAGVPVIYMKDGPLWHVEGPDGAGGCNTMKDAVKKLRKLRNGGQTLIKNIQADQKKILEAFSVEEAGAAWNDFLSFAEERITEARKQPKKPFRIAIVMPDSYTNGILDYSARLMRCIKLGAAEAGDQVELTFGYMNHSVFEEKEYFKPFQKEGVPVESFSWAVRDGAWLRRAVALDGCQMKEYPENCWVLDNGGMFFEDADHIIVTTDRVKGQVFSRCPMTVLAQGYTQRYVPEIMDIQNENNCYGFQRQAEAVFVTSEPNRINALQCGGNDPGKTYLTPLMFDLADRPKQRGAGGDPVLPGERTGLVRKKPRDFFLWSTNAAQHKNHLRALRALDEYYARGGRLKCYMTGAGTHLLDPKNDATDTGYVARIRQEIERNTALKGNLVILGELPKEQYIRLLEKAKFVFHPGYAGNGNGAVIDAACLGVPSISSDHPAMHYIDDKTGIHMHYFDPFDSGDMTEALFAAEEHATDYAALLPPAEMLKKHTVEGTYRELYQVVKEVAGI